MSTNVRQGKSRLATREHRYFYLFLSPWLLGFFGLTVGPMLYSLYCSFCSWDAITPPVWLGLGNYVKAFTANQDFWNALWNTLYYVVFSVPTSLGLALLLAFLLNKDRPGSGIFQAIFYFPTIAAGTAVFMVWTWLYNPETGVFNYFLSLIGIQGPAWLTSTEWAMPSIILMNMTFCGTSMLIFLAGLKQIPTTYYEAARIDGASEFRQFWSITVPMLSPIVLFNGVMGLINAFQVFGQPFILTNGGPMKSTYVYGLLIYDTGFRFYKFGEAAALSWILFVILIVASLLVIKLTSSRVTYDN